MSSMVVVPTRYIRIWILPADVKCYSVLSLVVFYAYSLDQGSTSEVTGIINTAESHERIWPLADAELTNSVCIFYLPMSLGLIRLPDT